MPQVVMNTMNIMGIIVYTVGLLFSAKYTVTVSSASPAINWLVAPNRGHITLALPRKAIK
ncbi:MAG: hypothetical protein BWY92_01747 [Firmicutes bacterium ADurb.BinA052]|nr:MAG: hypothetical protein BWY92_01747 [Firmicutes bacterium ADurb.BinA052]